MEKSSKKQHTIKLVEKRAKGEVKKNLGQTQTYKVAWMPYYELESFDIRESPKEVRLIFSDGSDLVCWKTVDNATLASLMPILNCDSLLVWWDPVTKEPVYICGLTKRKFPVEL